MRVLFAGSILMVVDSINNLVLHVQVWRTGEANFVVYQLLRVFFVPAGTMFVIAMAHRIALLSVMRPRWKRGFLWTVCGFAVYVAVQQCTLLVMSVLGKLDLTSDEWLQAVVFPEWSAYTIILLPIFCIIGSIGHFELHLEGSQRRPQNRATSIRMPASENGVAVTVSSSSRQPHNPS
ncbi:hypothetical protein BCR44DRAFT_1061418 [Catenaria anguillulae PL171]|uniref:Uncharacterized protein n=1 Tax=Catenaria anguillulae PL171 TaxID=765915 RepID=A0A1Y2HUR6_9FUNG|nr:hypothetical protein BCR44DRAFT_1061418 [Catenaria anguillulae PL171]